MIDIRKEPYSSCRNKIATELIDSTYAWCKLSVQYEEFQEFYRLMVTSYRDKGYKVGAVRLIDDTFILCLDKNKKEPFKWLSDITGVGPATLHDIK